ncbi:MAG: aspartate aminotransferase family protein [Verrucomicrobiales bacterium]|nr:aspartate aminotransferase family protein [Verrucomicrobiales bacterium]
MRSETILKCLRAYESRNVTFQDPDGSWPVVWKRAKGCRVWDEEGRVYLDLTAAFGVANAGHANSRVVRAGQHQMGQLLHAMGDVHPHRLKADLARELSQLTFGRWRARGRGKTIFCSSGFEAVEAALKTALLATGKPGIVAFEGGYHGLGYGALNATHRGHFRDPFLRQLRDFGSFLPFPSAAPGPVRGGASAPADLAPNLRELEHMLRRRVSQEPIGAILVEPIQARGGIRIPPRGFLSMLRRVATETGLLLILDEVYTGFGRTGRWFATEHESVIPDLVCLGKALTGGFPLSACIGEAGLMDRAWPEASGEAIHTSTFLGHPVGCAMALAQIREIRRRDLVRRSARLGRSLLQRLRAVRLPGRPNLRCEARGVGLMAGLQLHRSDGHPATAESLSAIKAMLQRGFVLLPEGADADVIGFTPPLVISERELDRAVEALQRCLDLDVRSAPLTGSP